MAATVVPAAWALPYLGGFALSGALLYMNDGVGAMNRRVRSALVQLRARRRGMNAVDGDRHGGPFGAN